MRRFAAVLAIAVVAALFSAPGASATSDNASTAGLVSSDLGPLGLRDDLNRYLAEQGGWTWRKTVVDGKVLQSFFQQNNVPPPPGLGGGTD